MFGIDSPELLVIAIVALVVIGPKELPNMLRGWGKWMAQMRGMAAEFRGHVDEMVRQSELDDVKKQLESTSGLDLQSLDPTKQIKSAIQEGMAEGEKAFNEAKSTFDNPLAEPESAPQIAAEPQPTVAEVAPPSPAAEAPSAVAEAPSAVAEAPSAVASETLPEPAPAAESPPVAAEEKPAKAVAAG
jgi:sec-independent protein translocase protein TatB